MNDYFGYNVSDEVLDFIKGMTDYAETNFGFAIASPEYYIYVDPIEDHIIVKLDENTELKFSDIREFVLNCELNGRKVIELLEEFDYA